MNRFAQKTVIVTGAASGIGRATLIRLVSEGAIALAVDLNEDGLKESVKLAQSAVSGGGRASHVVASIADEAAVKKIVADFVAKEGGLDVLVNMAGLIRVSHTPETSFEQFMSVLQINLGGTFLFCREALPHLIKRRGNIVNAASTSSYFGHPYMAAYAASKGGVAAMTHTLAWEFLKSGVRVNAVAPGGIATPLAQSVGGMFPEGADQSLFGHLQPMAGFGQPENVAGVIAMLASADGAHVNGEVVRIDGGVHS
ncbi:MAG: SDR family oxidoreductase [Proteobacteria bacterium]|nr:SDR family oxidoreductase [Pseudomonadota bacterium]